MKGAVVAAQQRKFSFFAKRNAKIRQAETENLFIGRRI
jgi:hypothetical protein